MVSTVGKAGLSRVAPRSSAAAVPCGQSARDGEGRPEGACSETERFEMLRMDSDMTAQKKKVPANSNTKKHDFKANDHVVYPTHGIGRIARVEEQEVAGTKLELFVITFEKDKMTLRVPTAKAKAVGMRKLSSPDVVAT